MKLFIRSVIALVLVVTAVLLINTVRLQPVDYDSPAVPKADLDIQAAGNRLARAVRIPTVSFGESSQIDFDQFLNLHRYIEDSYPLVHQVLERKVINTYSLLYQWNGSDPDLEPALLMGHMDVVPVSEETREQWIHPPFSGVVTDGVIWGRGTMDHKVGVFGILEAVELLLSEDYQPTRTVLLAFGHDEELFGSNGAREIAEYLRSGEVNPVFILDEGGTVISGIMPGLERPIALVGIAEKGSVSLELSVQTAGGHSSLPPAHTAIGILSSAIHRVEANPIPGAIDGPVKQMFTTLAPEMGFFQRLVFGNLWLFEGLVKKQLAGRATTNALFRTTTAVTMIKGGIKENVLPTEASAIVNFRIRPGDTINSVREHVRRIVEDPQVRIQPLENFHREASPISPADGQYYALISHTVRQVFPDAVVAPWLLTGGTDTKHFVDLSTNIYRFIPRRMGAEDVSKIHGINESIPLTAYHEAITFYTQLIRNTTSQ